MISGDLPEYPKELIDLGVAVEEGSLGDHLCKDAAQTPHVDRAGVPRGTQENLGGTIPKSDDL